MSEPEDELPDEDDPEDPEEPVWASTEAAMVADAAQTKLNLKNVFFISAVVLLLFFFLFDETTLPSAANERFATT